VAKETQPSNVYAVIITRTVIWWAGIPVECPSMVESVGVERRRQLGRPLLEKREKWRTPGYSGSVLKNKLALCFAVKVAHPPYSAITGFLDTEAPLLFGKLSGLISPLNPATAEKQFERVIELAELPDFRPGQKVDVQKLLKTRDSAECREFREWLSNLENASDAEIKEMVTSLRSKVASMAASPSGKLVRLATTTGIGLIPVVGPIAGAAAGAVDSFLVDKVLPRSGIVAFLTETYPSLFVSP